VKCIKSLSKRVSSIIRRYIDRMKFATYMVFFIYHILSCSFGFSFYHRIYNRTFCILLFDFVNYVILLLFLCILIVTFMYSICFVRVCSVLYILFSLCCSMYCLCVNVYCTTATG